MAKASSASKLSITPLHDRVIVQAAAAEEAMEAERRLETTTS